MNNSDKARFKNALVGASVIFTKEITKDFLNVMFESLKDLSIEDLERSIMTHIKTGKFFPKPAQLIYLINANKPNNKERALIAWLEVENAIVRVGQYRSLHLSDRLAIEVIKRIGGWQNICSLETKELSFKKREFIDAYTAIDHIDDNELPKSLAGLHTINNKRLESK